TWALILAATRHIPREDRNVREGRWQTTVGRVLHDKRLGILGYGRIGAQVAHIGKAFGMKVWAWGAEGSQSRARQDGYEVAPDRATFFAESDVLSVHLALGERSARSIRFEDLTLMRPGSLF